MSCSKYRLQGRNSSGNSLVFQIAVIYKKTRLLEILKIVTCITIIKQEHGIARFEYNDAKFFNKNNYVIWNSRTKNISASQLYEDLTYSFDELIERLEAYHTKDTKNGSKSTVIELPSQRSMIQTQHHFRHGKCYTFSPNDEIKSFGIEAISAWM